MVEAAQPPFPLQHAMIIPHPGEGPTLPPQPVDKRLRIEHLQVLAPKDLDRVVAAHAVASMQPTHATSDMGWAEARVGADRIKGAYAWRTMLDHHVPLAFGSDFPIEEVDPRLGLDAAVHRGNWHMEQAVSLDKALAAFTLSAAFAAFDETNTRADITIFDPRTIIDKGTVANPVVPSVGVEHVLIGGQVALSPDGVDLTKHLGKPITGVF